LRPNSTPEWSHSAQQNDRNSHPGWERSIRKSRDLTLLHGGYEKEGDLSGEGAWFEATGTLQPAPVVRADPVGSQAPREVIMGRISPNGDTLQIIAGSPPLIFRCLSPSVARARRRQLRDRCADGRTRYYCPLLSDRSKLRNLLSDCSLSASSGVGTNPGGPDAIPRHVEPLPGTARVRTRDYAATLRPIVSLVINYLWNRSLLRRRPSGDNDARPTWNRGTRFGKSERKSIHKHVQNVICNCIGRGARVRNAGSTAVQGGLDRSARFRVTWSLRRAAIRWTIIVQWPHACLHRLSFWRSYFRRWLKPPTHPASKLPL